MKTKKSVCTICGSESLVKTDEDGSTEVINVDKKVIDQLEEEVRNLEYELKMLNTMCDKGAD